MSRNRGSYTLEREDEEEELFPQAFLNGYSFVEWADEAGAALSADSVAQDKTFYAVYVDDIAPEISVSVTEREDGLQDFSIIGIDEGSGILGYYFGTSDPIQNEVTYSETNTGIIDSKGTYYFAVSDNAGNVTVENDTFYAFSLNANGGSVDCETILLAENMDFTLPAATKVGYSGVWVEDETEQIVTSSVADKDKSFTALWSANAYTITFDSNGGACNTGSKVVIYDETYGELPTPQRSGYSFLGWYSQPTGGEQILPENRVDCICDTTLYARWQSLTVTIPGGSLSVDDYWFPARNCSAGITLPVKSNIYITVTEHYGCVFWVEGISTSSIYSTGTFCVGTYPAGSYSFNLGANIASGSGNGKVSWSNITAVPTE